MMDVHEEGAPEPEQDMDVDNEIQINNPQDLDNPDQFISDIFADYQKERERHDNRAHSREPVSHDRDDRRRERDYHDNQPSTSRYRPQPRMDPVQRAEQMVRDAEAAKIRMLDATGITVI